MLVEDDRNATTKKKRNTILLISSSFHFVPGQAQDKNAITVDKLKRTTARAAAGPTPTPPSIIKLFFNNTQHHKVLQKWLKKRFWSACEALPPRIMQTN